MLLLSLPPCPDVPVSAQFALVCFLDALRSFCVTFGVPSVGERRGLDTMLVIGGLLATIQATPADPILLYSGALAVAARAFYSSSAHNMKLEEEEKRQKNSKYVYWEATSSILEMNL